MTDGSAKLYRTVPYVGNFIPRINEVNRKSSFEEHIYFLKATTIMEEANGVKVGAFFFSEDSFGENAIPDRMEDSTKVETSSLETAYNLLLDKNVKQEPGERSTKKRKGGGNLKRKREAPQNTQISPTDIDIGSLQTLIETIQVDETQKYNNSGKVNNIVNYLAALYLATWYYLSNDTPEERNTQSATLMYSNEIFKKTTTFNQLIKKLDNLKITSRDFVFDANKKPGLKVEMLDKSEQEYDGKNSYFISVRVEKERSDRRVNYFLTEVSFKKRDSGSSDTSSSDSSSDESSSELSSSDSSSDDDNGADHVELTPRIGETGDSAAGLFDGIGQNESSGENGDAGSKSPEISVSVDADNNGDQGTTPGISNALEAQAITEEDTQFVVAQLLEEIDSQYQKSYAQRDELNRIIQELKDEKAGLEKDIAELDDTREYTQTQNENIIKDERAKITETQRNLDKMRAEQKALKEKTDRESKKRQTELQQKITELQQKTEELQNVNSELTKKEQEMRTNNQLRAKNNKLKERIKQQIETIEERDRSLESKSEELSSLEQVLKNETQLKKIAWEHKKLAQTEKTNATKDLAKNNNEMKKILAENKNLAKQIGDLEKIRDELRGKVDSQPKLQETLDRVEKELKHLTEDNDEIKRNFDKSKEEKSKLETKLATAEATIKVFQDTLRQRKDNTSKLNTAERYLLEKTEALRQALILNNFVEETNKQLQEEKTSLESSLADAQNNLNTARQSLDAKKNEVRELSGLLEKLQEGLVNVEKQLRNETGNKEKSEQERERLKEEIAEVKQKIKDREKEVTFLKSNQNKLNNEVDNLKQKLSSAEEKIKNLNQANENLEAENATLKETLAQKRTTEKRRRAANEADGCMCFLVFIGGEQKFMLQIQPKISNQRVTDFMEGKARIESLMLKSSSGDSSERVYILRDIANKTVELIDPETGKKQGSAQTNGDEIKFEKIDNNNLLVKESLSLAMKMDDKTAGGVAIGSFLYYMSTLNYSSYAQSNLFALGLTSVALTFGRYGSKNVIKETKDYTADFKTKVREILIPDDD